MNGKRVSESSTFMAISMNPVDANPYGNVHGGVIMKHVDTAGGAAAIRHARAKNVFVNLIRKDGLLILTVEDDGKGFQYRALDIGHNPQASLGIMIMRERAAQVEGSFRIESEIGKGTQVIVEIPVDGEK